MESLCAALSVHGSPTMMPFNGTTSFAMGSVNNSLVNVGMYTPAYDSPVVVIIIIIQPTQK